MQSFNERQCEQRTGFSFEFLQEMFVKYFSNLDSVEFIDFLRLLNYYRHYLVQREFAHGLGFTNHGNVFKEMKKTSVLLNDRISELPLSNEYLLGDSNLILWRGQRVVGSVDTFPIYVERPQANQALFYNGKYKAHVVKIQGFSDNLSNIFAFTGPHLGTKHDIAIYRDTSVNLPSDCFLLGDKAYTTRNSRQMNLIVPFKRIPGGSLTLDQMEFNSSMSPLRGRVEHAFGYLKRFGILSQTYRGKLFSQDGLPTELDRCIQIIVHLNFAYLRKYPIRELWNTGE